MSLKRSRAIQKWNGPRLMPILLFALAGLVVYLLVKGRIAQYNEERMEIERDEKGRIKSLLVRRKVHD